MSTLVSPFDDQTLEPHAAANRLDTLEGKRVTLFSISKPKSAEFLQELESALVDDYGAVVSHAAKPTFATPAPIPIVDEVVERSDAIIEALAD